MSVFKMLTISINESFIYNSYATLATQYDNAFSYYFWIFLGLEFQWVVGPCSLIIHFPFSNFNLYMYGN